MRTSVMTARCACGGVEFTATGAPIASSVCYCADCQDGARQIQALPGAAAVADPDGGTAYILFRKDRIACSNGAERLRRYKLKQTSGTNRAVATCCNAAMFVDFDKGPHWVSAYRARFRGEPPPLDFRMCTKSRPDGVVVPDDAPQAEGYPPALLLKLLASRLAMLFGR